MGNDTFGTNNASAMIKIGIVCSLFHVWEELMNRRLDRKCGLISRSPPSLLTYIETFLGIPFLL